MRRLLFALPTGRINGVDGSYIELILESFRVLFHENVLNMSQEMEYEAVSVSMPTSIVQQNLPIFEARNLVMRWKRGLDSIKQMLQNTRLTRPCAHMVAQHLAYMALLAVTSNNPQLGLINSLDIVILTQSISSEVQSEFWFLFQRDLRSFLAPLPPNRLNCTLTLWNISFTSEKHPKIVPMSETEMPSMYMPSHGFHCSYKRITLPDSVDHKGHYTVYLVMNMEAMGLICRLHIDPGCSYIFTTANVENFLRKASDGRLLLKYKENFTPTMLIEYNVFFSCSYGGMDSVPAPILFTSSGICGDEVFIIMMGGDKLSRRLMFCRRDPLPRLLQDEANITVRALKTKITSSEITQTELETLCTMLQTMCTLSLKNEQDRYATSTLFREVETMCRRFSCLSGRHKQLFDFIKRINTQHNVNINYNNDAKRISQRPYTERRYKPYLESVAPPVFPEPAQQSQLRLVDSRVIEGRQPNFQNPQFVTSNKQLGTGVNMVEF